jgi:hypothetical protein
MDARLMRKGAVALGRVSMMLRKKDWKDLFGLIFGDRGETYPGTGYAIPTYLY